MFMIGKKFVAKVRIIIHTTKINSEILCAHSSAKLLRLSKKRTSFFVLFSTFCNFAHESKLGIIQTIMHDKYNNKNLK
jgi:hypothetical protein